MPKASRPIPRQTYEWGYGRWRLGAETSLSAYVSCAGLRQMRVPPLALRRGPLGCPLLSPKAVAHFQQRQERSAVEVVAAGSATRTLQVLASARQRCPMLRLND